MRIVIIYILITIAFFCCKTENKKLEYKSGEWTIDECVQPIDAVLYSDYIVLLENITNLYYTSDIRFESPKRIYAKTKFTVINYYTNEIDTLFQNGINRNGISGLYVKKDTLYAFDVFKKSWLQWNNKWIEKSPFNNEFYLEFEKSYLKSRCRLIYEDEKYFIYSYDYGEFGSGVLFLNKGNGKLSGHRMICPTSVFRDTNSYVISGNLEIYKTMSQLIRVKDPDKLPIVPDDQIIYEKDTAKYDYRYQENLAEYLYSEIHHKLPDSLQLKLQSIRKEIKDFNNREDLDFDKRIVFEKQIDTLFKFDKNLEYLFDNSYWHLDDETQCYASFIYNDKLLHILGDSILYVTEFINNDVIKLRDTIITNNIPLSYPISNWQINDKRLIVFNANWRVDTCSAVNCLVIDNEYIKRYNFK